MNPLSKPLKQTWIFFALTLGLVFFVFWGPLALFGIPGPSLEAGNSGPPWVVVLFVLGGFTLSLVALFLTWQADGQVGLLAMVKRLNPRTISIKWHLAILFVIGLATLSQLIIIRLLGYNFDLALFVQRLPLLLPLFFLGPLSEELGWRGYALGRLLTRWNAYFSC